MMNLMWHWVQKCGKVYASENKRLLGYFIAKGRILIGQLLEVLIVSAIRSIIIGISTYMVKNML